MQRLPRPLLLITTAVALLVAGWLASAAVTRPPVATLRSDLQHILARPEFRQAHNEWLYDLATRLLRRLGDWWREHVAGRLEGLAEHAPVLYWTIVALNLLLALLLIYHIYVTVRSAFGTGRRRRTLAAAPLPAAPSSEPQTLMEQADAAAAAGRFSEALRFLYLALIHQLDRRDIVRYDLAHTNQDYVRQARRHAVIVAPLRDVSRMADRAWYGQYGLGRTEYDHCRELVLAAWQEAEHAAAL
jgi:hypothetical protein